MNKIIAIFLTVLILVGDAISTDEACEVRDIKTCKSINHTQILEVLVNNSKLHLNATNITDYLELPRRLEDVTPTTEHKDRYFLADRRRTCLKNVTKCLAEGEFIILIYLQFSYNSLLFQNILSLLI